MAGVSLAAASAALNGTKGSRVSDATRQRIQETAAQLGFTVNPAAKALATRQSRTIGFVSDGIAAGDFAGEQITGSHRVARESGFAVFIVDTEDNGGDAASVVEAMIERRVEGVIFAARVAKVVTPPENLSRLPAVLLNCLTPRQSRFPTVLADDVAGSYGATSMLIGRGHERIAFISGAAAANASLATSRRQAGFELALKDAGLEVPPGLVRAGNYEADMARAIARDLLGSPGRPTAIVCANDRTAFGVYQAARELGIRIPDDLSVIGYDDQHLSRYYDPPLSTVRLPHDEMGALAMQILYAMLNGDPPPPTPQYVVPTLVERESTADKP